ncbi:uncharacterized protein LOC131362099 isoform X2 [Hemibagrus wyckioides]|uniref:uncharacterized protein LOC131362099 isoform X2 n=1 Tax=Hemibagrus wyckioides TaxID=337641 RepID=UPI00266C790B|nr:uncharacterized protein LOC131362099 isoform X2 [Hemibagrus wyckioides]
MVSQGEQNALPKPPLLFVGAKDSKRLLEVYVKRSLSLNDGTQCPPRRERRTHKWVTAAERDKRDRKHSSDTSLHLKPSGSEEDFGEDEAFSEPEPDRKDQEECETTDNRSKLLKNKNTHSRNNGSSASHTSDGKPQKWSVHFDKEKPDVRQTNIASIHPKPSATEEELSKVKVFEPVTESETSDKHKRWRKSSLTRKDGSSVSQGSDGKPRKWFSHFDKDKRNSGLPQDSSKADLEDLKIVSSLLPAQPQAESVTEVKKSKEGKKIKRPSILKSFLGWFTRGNTEKQDEQDDDGKTEETVPTPEPATPPLSCLPISTGDGIILRHTKSTRRRRSQRRLSLKRRSGDMGLDKTTMRPLTLDLSTEAHNSQVQSIEEVEATSSYYEKMSEELEKIVNEVKNSPTEENKTFAASIQPTDAVASSRSQEEIIKRIIDLIKQEGDVINDKLKENTIISSYFNTITYGSFQQLADQYVNSEAHQQTTQQPVVATELVKFAFTLDFTARVAGLSRHAPGHILGFGNQYLKERFIYTCESHPHFTDTSTDMNSDRDERLGDHAASETDGPKH